MCHQIIIDSRDKFFFRDARPISGSDIGDGANWPLPSLIHSAMLSALAARFPDTSVWESRHVNLSEKEKRKHNGGKDIVSNFRLGGLKTWGIFPVKRRQMKDGTWNDEIFVPAPADIAPDGSAMELVRPFGVSNLPAPLKYSVASMSAPSKKEVGPWISMANLERYLNGDSAIETFKSSGLYSAENAPGIEIDSATGTAVDKKFFQTVYLRLDKDVSMLAFAECEAKKYSGKNGVDIIELLFEDKKTIPLIFGGQRGLAYLECRREKTDLCRVLGATPDVSGNMIRWTLISPAIFNGGWLPDWVSPENDGKVMLKSRPEKQDMSRVEWRRQIEKAPAIGARLVAARIPKPVVVSGWKLDKDSDGARGMPKATRLAVQAGSVYYFECDNNDEAAKLVKELHGNVKSSLLGEQGFGLGVCSSLKNGVEGIY